MNDTNRIWQLLARKMAGEASTEELQALQDLLDNNPELHYFVNTLENAKDETETLPDEDVEQAFKRHMVRLNHATKTAEKTNREKAKPQHRENILNTAILTSYFKVIVRNLIRFKGFSFINISGLAIGMASAILILLLIQNELSFDQFHKNKDRIYILYNRATVNGKIECWGGVPTLITPVLQTSYPQVEQVTRINGVGPLILHVGDRNFKGNGMMADPGFLKIFSFPLISGNPDQALNSPRSMVISEKFAKETFPGGNALGQTIRIDSNAYFRVDGIVKDMPNNTALGFDYVIPYSYMKEIGWYKPSWTDDNTGTFVMLKPGVSQQTADNFLKNIIKDHAGKVSNEVFLYPLTRWHLYGNFENGKEAGGNIQYIRLFAIIAAFILLIACINYMNLSTARSIKKAKEIGVRKVVGAGKASIILRFLGESVLIAALAGAIAIVIVQSSIKGFNWLTYKDLYVPYDNLYFWLGIIAFTLLTGLIAGSYPAFYLSAYKPISVLKGSFKTAYNLVSVRKVLVVFQFCFAITFIICTAMIYRQINYASKRDPGYNRDHLAFAYINGDINKRYAAIKQELLEGGAATAVTRTNSPITYVWTTNNDYKWQGADPNRKLEFNEFHVDNDFLETVGLKLIAGRTINTVAYPTDSTALLLTKSTVDAMGLKDPIGKIINNHDGNWTVVGIVQDFVPGSPFWSAKPVIIQGPKNWLGAVMLKLSPKNSMADDIKKIETIFKKYNPDYPFYYRFVDEADAEKFEGERRVGIQSALFGGLAILISCLGLFALSAYMAENRIKEIGVRKVLGATVANIWQLLSKDFVVLVLIAFVIASPVAYFLMHSWMQNYEYRASLSWWIFASAGAGALLITLLTVSFQAIKAAIANPVNSLRAE